MENKTTPMFIDWRVSENGLMEEEASIESNGAYLFTASKINIS